MNIRRWIIIIVHIALITAAFFTSYIPFDGRMAIVSTFFTFVLCLPAAFATTRWLGWKKGLGLLVITGSFAVAIEALALRFGVPYGEFVYNAKTGIMIGNMVPLSTPFAWVPILVGSAGLVGTLRQPFLITLSLTAATMVWIDLLLDPVAVTLGLWQWKNLGIYYGVPLINYAGWVVSSVIGSCIFYMYIKKFAKNSIPPTTLAVSLYASCIFWLALALFLELYLPCLFGVLFLCVYARQFKQALTEFAYV